LDAVDFGGEVAEVGREISYLGLQVFHCLHLCLDLGLCFLLDHLHEFVFHVVFEFV
jgi:hypothetical protein